MKIKKICSLIWNGLYYLHYYIVGNLLLSLYYNRSKIVDSKYFHGRYKNLIAPGWKWVVDDYRNCKRKQINQNALWPVSGDIRVVCPANIQFHPDDLNNFQGFGNYYQAIGKITIGHGTYIAANVGIITANHDLSNLDLHTEARPVTLGEKCWVGMNSMILPGVTLGDNTIVGAGSVVTKSFPEGHCVIAGNPAKLIRKLKSEENERSQ